MAQKIPEYVIAACVLARLNPAKLFCWDRTDTEVVLNVSGRAGEIRVKLSQLPAGLFPLPDRPRTGPGPQDTRAQDAPGRAEA